MWIGLGILVVLLVILVLLAPTIAGSLAPGIAARQINAQIMGHAEVGGASFSWTGGQTLGPVILGVFTPVIFATAPSVARLPRRMARCPWG